MSVQARVVAFIRRERLLAPGGRVVVGVSGGPDSLCLLHLLNACHEDLGIELVAAHLNHCIRGSDAAQDAQFVLEIAAAWGVPCVSEERDVPAFAREQGIALEEAARRVRYTFLGQVAARVGATRVAVGHNADDQSETVLMHWLRGAGLAGLRGMLPVTRMADLCLAPESLSPDLWLVRPLLATERVDILGYCREFGLEPRFDRSNLDTTYYRNKLRHELLPHLEREYKPRFREILRRSAKVIQADYDLLTRVRDDAWEQVLVGLSVECVTFDLARWRALHLALQRAILRRAVKHLRMNLRDVSLEQIDAAAEIAQGGEAGARATLPRDVMLTVGYERLFVAHAGAVPPADWPALGEVRAGGAPLRLAVPGVTGLGSGWQVRIGLVSIADLPEGWEANADPWQAFLDADAIGEELTVRGRQPGDRFEPLGLDGKHKPVADLLAEARVPAWWRDRIPLLVRSDGEIMWVCGWRIDHRARLRDATRRVAVLRLERDAEERSHG